MENGNNIIIKNGDCFEFLKEIKDCSIDLILIDPPYGTIKGLKDTRGSYNRDTSWDNILPVDKFFSECNRVLKNSGIAIVFAQEPFTSKLINNQHGNLPFLYRAIWKKNNSGNALSAKKALLNYYEDILFFSKRNYDYNLSHPLRSYAKDILSYTQLNSSKIQKQFNNSALSHFFTDGFQFSIPKESLYKEMTEFYKLNEMDNYLSYQELKNQYSSYRNKNKTFNLNGKKSISNIFEYSKPSGNEKVAHPTQKPVELLEDLIKIFSNEGETVLDFTMGSGSTGIACLNTNRNFIGCELDENYFNIAKDRIENQKLKRNK